MAIEAVDTRARGLRPRREAEAVGLEGAVRRLDWLLLAALAAVTAYGLWAIDVRYANGSGPVNTDAKGALRTLLVDGDTVGVVVMPQRGSGRWSDWGYGNALPVRLAAGAHTIRLALTPLDENMDRRVNTALLDHVRLTPLPAGAARPIPPRQ